MKLPPKYVELSEAIKRVFPGSQFELVDESGISEIRNSNPGIAEHYLDFLRFIGWGSLGEMSCFMFYSGPVEADEIFDKETASTLKGILFIGDDLAGWELGFNSQDGWRMVGVDSASPKAHTLKTQTVSDFVFQLIEAESNP